MAGGHAGISVEELPGTVVIFRELNVVNSLVVFTVIVKDVESFFVEILGDFGVFVEHVSKVCFLKIGVQGSVSKSGIEEEPGEDGQKLETESNISKHVEGKGNSWKGVDLEGIIDSMSSFPPLIQTWEVS